MHGNLLFISLDRTIIHGAVVGIGGKRVQSGIKVGVYDRHSDSYR